MEKLELKYLASYMPYKLHGFVVTNKANFEVEIVGWNYDTLKTSPSIHGYTHCSFDDFKPILHPLSDIAKPCLPEGKVPVVELLKLTNEAWFKKHPDGKYSEVHYEQNGWHVKAYVKYHAIVDIDLHTGFVHNWPYWIFEWLSEHHFDVYGLIDQGLAIDINTIKS